MEADKSLDLHLAGWRPRGANSIVFFLIFTFTLGLGAHVQVYYEGKLCATEVCCTNEHITR